MRIDDKTAKEILGSQSHEVQGVDRHVAEEPGKNTEIQRDETILSPDARLMQRVHRAIGEVPDVREDKIAALRQQIQDGTYQIDVEALIRALLGGHGSGAQPVQ
ncbi:MAG: flagellar biosynthesis anti-sigma factor FlgM [Anaerolineae bacterium]